MKTCVQPGKIVGMVAPSGGVTVGVPKIIGSLCVIPEATAAEGERFAAYLTGVFLLPKVSGTAFAAGAVVDWDPTPGQCVAAGNVATNWAIGYCVEAAATTDAYVLVTKALETATAQTGS